MNKRIWHGVDVDNETSLFEYGFLMRWNAKDKDYQVIYKYCDQFGFPRYYYSWFNPAEYRNPESCNLDMQEVCNMTGETDLITYLRDTSDCNLLSDLIVYYGTETIFGSEYHGGYTESKIRKRLNKAL